MRRIISLGFMMAVLVSSNAQTTSKYIVVDQFGYLPDAEKVAIIRNPQVGFDSNESYEPGTQFSLRDANTNESVFSADIIQWNGGNTDNSSGDRVWWFDFSEFTENGTFYVFDETNNTKSHNFNISPAVYNEVLKHAVRTFFYQRAGFEKAAQYAGEAWADGASHAGTNQDQEARLFNDVSNEATARDLSGGWYDAGDYNKYTNWTANYVTEMMKAYLEAPEAWGDDYNIPESGNGIPDLLDEAKWGVDHLLRLQQEDGSVLSIVDLDHNSPPSAANGRSLYGPENTSASLNTAGALAISSKVYGQVGMTDYAETLLAQAIVAWDWAVANPNVLFRNNDPEYGSQGIGAGQQEESDYQRLMTKLEAAVFLFEATGDSEYRTFFDANYTESQLLDWSYAYPFQGMNQDALLYYTTLDNATAGVVSDILSAYGGSMENSDDNFPAYQNDEDPYRAHLGSYTWGSNSVKSLQGSMFYNIITYDINASREDDAYQAALNFVNYIHGTNPLNMVYLSNMYAYGGDNCVNEFYHTWFTDGSALWDRVGESTYGPAPGFLVGGPNPSYGVDGCCPSGCGSSENNNRCDTSDLSPPLDQPEQKSYKDWNTSWPQNSWSVTENSCGYQVNYIKLLSKFVNLSFDCNGDENGGAFIDACGNCAGGNTGIDPVTDPSECQPPLRIRESLKEDLGFEVYPNPSNGIFSIKLNRPDSLTVSISNIAGRTVMQTKVASGAQVDLSAFPPGSYFMQFAFQNQSFVQKIVKY